MMTGCQGTFGVITIMNVKIFHKALMQKLVILPFNTLEDVVKPLYTIQRREIGHECFVLNKYDLAAILAESAEEISASRKKTSAVLHRAEPLGRTIFPRRTHRV